MSVRCALPGGVPRARLPRLVPPPDRAGPSVIRWPVVAGAGGVTAFVMLCVTALVWGEVRHPDKNRAARPAPAERVAKEQPTPAHWEASATEDEPSAEEYVVSFRKASFSPLLGEAELVALDLGPGLPPSERPAVCKENVDGMHGTAVVFARGPVEAARKAVDESKLLFTLHLSGHFEDAGFT